MLLASFSAHVLGEKFLNFMELLNVFMERNNYGFLRLIAITATITADIVKHIFIVFVHLILVCPYRMIMRQ